MTKPLLQTDQPTVDGVAAVRAAVGRWKSQGFSVGLVPTMGALHEGHLALVDLALAQADRVVASIFVNPAQFSAGEDLDTYPRTLAEDTEKLARRGCHLLYAPTVADMYPGGFSTRVVPAGAAEGLEAAARPHFFGGVATVVLKLLTQVRPDVAVFGEKDYQQLLVIQRMVADFDLAVEILAGPTEREPDGLALSSRNTYLDAKSRAMAPSLYRVLRDAAGALAAGLPPGRVETTAEAALLRAGFHVVDYAVVRDAETLAPVTDPAPRQALRVLAAARLGDVRLLDNVPAIAP